MDIDIDTVVVLTISGFCHCIPSVVPLSLHSHSAPRVFLHASRVSFFLSGTLPQMPRWCRTLPVSTTWRRISSRTAPCGSSYWAIEPLPPLYYSLDYNCRSNMWVNELIAPTQHFILNERPSMFKLWLNFRPSSVKCMMVINCCRLLIVLSVHPPPVQSLAIGSLWFSNSCFLIPRPGPVVQFSSFGASLETKCKHTL